MAGEVDAVHDKFGKLEFFCISVEAVAMCVTRVVVNPTAQGSGTSSTIGSKYCGINSECDPSLNCN